MDWQKDKQNVIDHMILLRRCDRTYANWALEQYLAMPNCPHPEVGQDVRNRWSAMTEEQRMPPWAKRPSGSTAATSTTPTSESSAG